MTHPQRYPHPVANTPLYKQWKSFRSRIRNNPKYTGTRVDERWATFQGFLDNQPPGRPYEPGLCLCRFEDKGDYTPENTRWATRGENTREYLNNLRVGNEVIEILTAALARLDERDAAALPAP